MITGTPGGRARRLPHGELVEVRSRTAGPGAGQPRSSRRWRRSRRHVDRPIAAVAGSLPGRNDEVTRGPDRVVGDAAVQRCGAGRTRVRRSPHPRLRHHRQPGVSEVPRPTGRALRPGRDAGARRRRHQHERLDPAQACRGCHAVARLIRRPPLSCHHGGRWPLHYRGAGRVRTCIRSPGRPKMLRISAGPAPVLPNQCGTVVSNSAISPGPSTQSWSPRMRRIRPDRT